MNSRRSNRVVAAGSIALLSALVISRIAAPPMPGMWADVYTSHVAFWGGIIAVLVCLAIWCTWNPMPWWQICIIGIVAITAMGTVAIQWGVPYPLQDPWSHLDFIRTRTLAGRNPYPAFHTLILTLVSLTGLPAVHWMTIIGVLSAVIGALGVAALLSRLPLHVRATQPAFIAFLPAITQGFVSRPFMVSFATLLPPALLLIIYLLEQNSIPQKRINLLMVILWCSIPIWHPQLLWYICTIATATVLVIWLSHTRLTDSLPNIKNISPLPHFGIAVVLLPWTVFIAYMTLVTPVGVGIIATTIEKYVTTGMVQETAAASQGTGVFSFLTSAAAAQEAFVRFAFPGFFLFAAGVAFIEQLWRWEFDSIFLTLTIAGGTMVGLFFLAFLFSSALGIERFVALVPLVLFPVAAYAFREWPMGRVGLVVCLLCAGVIGIYPSTFSGQTGVSATTATPAGMGWVADHGMNENILGSGINRQLKAATQKGNIWNRYKSIFMERWPWTTDQPSLVIIQAADRAGMRQYIAESGNQSLRYRYSNFTANCRKVYDNGGTTICRI